ncbi:kinase-like domain-containing protein [Gigaspora rosea]|uniref:Kinase-like domain-containing protein n=1 Tax=Gigaspora rosea TaxID=44941 RepID=A0A397VET0_9GLOM|nr:kinase-like domain-containing protein [Gigaspora rosea]
MFKTGPEFIPSRTNLLKYIQQPFSEPIQVHPINYNYYFKSKLDPGILDKFFVRSFNASSRLWSEYLIQIPFPPEFGSTEDSFHSFWDALICNPFKIACPSGNFNRNSNCHISTKRFRPDYSYVVFDACLTRGEEKGPSDNDDPAVELTSKLTWTYGNCPYIFGYYAQGTAVTYCYLYFEEGQVKRKDLFTCRLETLEGRIQAFNIGINIGRLLPLLRQTLPESFEREFIVLHRSSGKTIELLRATVVKRYNSVESVEKPKTLYRKMEEYRIPFIDHLTHANTEESTTPFAIFSPKGVFHKPDSKEQLIKALYCVLTAIKSLHEIDIMHRDLRWDNVLRFIDQDKWFIIDFDDACHIPSNTPNINLAHDSHAPEIFQSDHDESVDIWSVGYLIKTAFVDVQELSDYARTKLMADDLDRPTAKEALIWLRDNYRDILKEFLEEDIMKES